MYDVCLSKAIPISQESKRTYVTGSGRTTDHYLGFLKKKHFSG